MSEVSQAKIRVGLHTLFVILTLAAYKFDSGIEFQSVVLVSVASFIAAFSLYFWATHLQSSNAPLSNRILQRAAGIVSDNLFVTLVLAIGGQSTAGLWTIYIWTSIGYGVRYGIPYLHANVLVSAISFALMASLTQFWEERPPFVTGMLIGMVLVPIYTGFLIRQLHKAVQEKEIAYKAKSEFLARMSHELRTPLHAIISTAELLRGKAKSATQNDYIDTIALSSATLLELINRVLDLSKFESGGMGLGTERINVHHLLADAVNVIYQQAQAKSVPIRLFIDPDIPLNLVGSPAHVREIFLNLLGNAVKFTDRGFVAISAHLDTDAASRAKIVFDITDSGCGIPERDLARIFEPFMQADSSITRKHGGSGLGTSFSREIIRLMGGDISISSKIGLGTTVKFTIPFDRIPIEQDATTSYDVRVAVLGDHTSNSFVKHLVDNFGAVVIYYENLNDISQDLLSPLPGSRIDGLFVDADLWGHRLATIPKRIADLDLPRLVPIVGFGDPTLKTVAVSCWYSAYINREPTSLQLSSVLSTIESLSKKGLPGSLKDPERVPSKPLNVLVADDNATNRKIAQIALEDAGHKCTLVTNGDDALFSLNDVEFDVAILDMHMPGRDGIEVAKIYRFAGFANANPIPIILLTADCTNEAREEAESAGISRFLTKPILPSEMVGVVEELARAHGDLSSEARGTVLRARDGSIEPWSATAAASQSEHDVPILNEQAVAELVSLMSKQEQTEFFAEFCEDAFDYVRVVESIRTASDISAARDAMHALAGAALIVGAGRLAYVARSIEKGEQGAVLMKRDEYVAELKAICDETILQLNRHFMSSPPANRA